MNEQDTFTLQIRVTENILAQAGTGDVGGRELWAGLMRVQAGLWPPQAKGRAGGRPAGRHLEFLYHSPTRCYILANFLPDRLVF
jgi:hypothetical protein